MTDTPKPTDPRAALFTAAVDFMNEGARQLGDELEALKAGGEAKVDVRIRDLAGARPRLELIVVDAAGERVVVHVDIARHDEASGKPN